MGTHLCCLFAGQIYDDYTEDQKSALSAVVEKYIRGEVDDIEVSLEKNRYCCMSFHVGEFDVEYSRTRVREAQTLRHVNLYQYKTCHKPYTQKECIIWVFCDEQMRERLYGTHNLCHHSPVRCRWLSIRERERERNNLKFAPETWNNSHEHMRPVAAISCRFADLDD